MCLALMLKFRPKYRTVTPPSKCREKQADRTASLIIKKSLAIPNGFNTI